MCQNNATEFCINDNAYFCASCDQNYHEETEFKFNHERVPAQDKHEFFGKCSNSAAHREKNKYNEYFCHKSNKAFCSLCLLEGLPGKAHDHKPISI
jgi:hypothetical protein